MVSGQILKRSAELINKDYKTWHPKSAPELRMEMRLNSRTQVLGLLSSYKERGFGITETAARALQAILDANERDSSPGTVFQCPIIRVGAERNSYEGLLEKVRKMGRILPKLAPLELMSYVDIPEIGEAEKFYPVTEPTVIDGEPYYPVVMRNGPTLDYKHARAYLLGQFAKLFLAGPVPVHWS